jgi:flagellar motor protein MotB
MQNQEEGAPPERRRPLNLSAMLAFALLALAVCVAVVAAQIWQWRQETRDELSALRASVLTEEGFRSIAGSLPTTGATRDASLPRAVVDLIKLELPPLLGAATPPMPILVEPVEDLVLHRTVTFARIGADGGAEIRRTIDGLRKELLIAAAGRDCTVVVDGHTDTKGSDTANLDLSEKRARFVADAITGEFGHGAMAVAGWGERRLKVLTADGVDEIENRRVDITLTCPPPAKAASLIRTQ